MKQEHEVSLPTERPTVAQVQAITEQYDSAPLECDGLTNVFHFFLTQAGIAHAVFHGQVEDRETGEGFAPHRWIRLETKEGPMVVDYRARMWLGERESIPHGVFSLSDYPHIRYQGRKITPLALPEAVIRFLLAAQ